MQEVSHQDVARCAGRAREFGVDVRLKMSRSGLISTEQMEEDWGIAPKNLIGISEGHRLS
jgi:hypothetical protein